MPALSVANAPARQPTTTRSTNPAPASRDATRNANRGTARDANPDVTRGNAQGTDFQAFLSPASASTPRADRSLRDGDNAGVRDKLDDDSERSNDEDHLVTSGELPNQDRPIAGRRRERGADSKSNGRKITGSTGDKLSGKMGNVAANQDSLFEAADLLIRKSASAPIENGAPATNVDVATLANASHDKAVDEGALAAQSSHAASHIASDDFPGADSASKAPEAVATTEVRVATPELAKPVVVAAPTATPTVLPSRAMAAVQSALAQEGVNIRLFENGARLSVQMADGTELSLRLFMRDGAVEVRAAGAAAALLETRAPELRAALSQEGLRLAGLNTGASGFDGNRSGEGRDESQIAADGESGGDVPSSSSSSTSKAIRRQHDGRSIVA